MSTFGNVEKDELFLGMYDFLMKHSMSEFMEVVSSAVQEAEWIKELREKNKND